jgi:hypothetical protein
MTQHPITPPPSELVLQWIGEFFGCTAGGELSDSERFLTTRAAQWGADQELEACCSLLELSDDNAREFLQSARRPKPPSLKEQAQAELKRLISLIPTEGAIAMAEPIRRALEQLPDNE